MRRAYNGTTTFIIGTIALTAGSFFVASSAMAANYYVDPVNGNDARSCAEAQNITTPKKSLNDTNSGAVPACLGAGDTLYLRGGVYNTYLISAEFFQVPTGGGTASSPITIEGYGNEEAIIRCSASGPWGCSGMALNLADIAYMRVRKVIVDMVNAGAGTGGVLLGPNSIFENNSILNTPRDALGAFGPNQIIRNNHIHTCGTNFPNPHEVKGVGMHMYDANHAQGNSNSIIEGNIIENCAAAGIAIQQSGNSNNVIVRNNIIRNIGTYVNFTPNIGDYGHPMTGSALNFGHGSNFQVYNNIIYNVGSVSGNGADCIFLWGGGNGRPKLRGIQVWNNTCHNTENGIAEWPDEVENATFRNNIFSGMVKTCWSTSCTSPGFSNANFITDPTYMNSGSGDFRLAQGSSGIDIGIASSFFSTDKNGVSRPQGTAWDIGAYELGSSQTTPPPPPPVPSTCTNLWNNTLAVPSGFGASFNLFSSLRELLMNASCPISGSANILVGNSSPYQYIYKTGYTWTNNQWTPFNYSGSQMSSDGNWFIGSASKSLSGLDSTQKQSVLAYICEYVNSAWKCGCNTSACTQSFWNLQQFK